MSRSTFVAYSAQAPGARLEPVHYEAPELKDDEVRVAVTHCGVCHTDLGFYYDGIRTKHELPLALGHEISGRVVAAAPDVETWNGTAVIIPAVIPCGQCDLCQRGKYAICPNQKMPGNDIQGGFATHICSGLQPGIEWEDILHLLDEVGEAILADAVARSPRTEEDLARLGSLCEIPLQPTKDAK